MTKLSLIAAAALPIAIALVAPVAAQDTHRAKPGPRTATVSGEPSLPIENALRWGYSQGHSNYPSGFGGLYGDGRYPDNTVSNPHSYNNLR